MTELNISDVNENDFETKVINSSNDKLIIVDFWAPWCGPCKQLTPIMEKVAKENQDTFDLVKINIDDNQQIAAQLRIQSIPTVYAFKDKKVVNAFQGVISEREFVEFIEKSIGKKLEEDKSLFYKKIKKLISSGSIDDAKDNLLGFFSENAQDPTAISLYLECLLVQKEFLEIEEFINSLNEEIKSNQEIVKIIKKINIVRSAKTSRPIEELLEINRKEPDNINIVFEISEYYFSAEDYDNSFSFLIDNYFIDKENVKKKLVEFFEALGNSHDATKTYRKRLSSLIFS